VTDAFAGDARVVCILRNIDRGFAKSIRTGIEIATGDRIIVMDSDLTHDPVEIPRLLHVGNVYDLVSGSRFCAGGRMVDTMHYTMSMMYNWVIRLVLRTQVQDNLGGYYTIRKASLAKLPFDDIFFGYGEYYFRLLHHAQLSGMTIVEIPAQYLPRGEGKSKSNWMSMIFMYTGAAVRLKLKLRRQRARL
jgi:glycosyltransferase involved in cell wall biosynthesis